MADPRDDEHVKMDQDQVDFPGGPRKADYDQFKDLQTAEKESHDGLPEQHVPTQEELDKAQPDKPTEPQKAKVRQSKAQSKELAAERKKHAQDAPKPEGDEQTGALHPGQHTVDVPNMPQRAKMAELADKLEESPEYKREVERLEGDYTIFNAADAKKAKLMDPKAVDAKQKEEDDKAAEDADKAASHRLEVELPKAHLPGFKSPAELKAEREAARPKTVTVKATVSNNNTAVIFDADVPEDQLEYGDYPLSHWPDFVNEIVNKQLQSKDCPLEFRMQLPHHVKVEPKD